MSALPISNSNERLDDLIAKVNEVAVLPHVVFKVLEISGSTESPAADMEKAIVVDPGFTSKLLILANSAHYALPKKVISIKEAIMFLGYKSVRQLAMTVGMFDLFVGKNDAESLRRRAWWRHSVDTAVCCRWMAEKSKVIPAEDAYTCGLLHYIGKTLLDRFGQGKYEQVERLIQAGLSELRSEYEVFGCDHVMVAMAAAQKWGFPEQLIYGLNYVAPASADDPFKLYSANLALGSSISHYALEGTGQDHSALDLPVWALELLGYGPEQVSELVTGSTAAIASASTMQL
jgi:HD-like signal output (HDOD) protein